MDHLAKSSGRPSAGRLLSLVVLFLAGCTNNEPPKEKTRPMPQMPLTFNLSDVDEAARWYVEKKALAARLAQSGNQLTATEAEEKIKATLDKQSGKFIDWKMPIGHIDSGGVFTQPISQQLLHRLTPAQQQMAGRQTIDIDIPILGIFPGYFAIDDKKWLREKRRGDRVLIKGEIDSISEETGDPMMPKWLCVRIWKYKATPISR